MSTNKLPERDAVAEAAVEPLDAAPADLEVPEDTAEGVSGGVGAAFFVDIA